MFRYPIFCINVKLTVFTLLTLNFNLMSAGDWVFRPKLLPSLAVLAMFPALILLGFWQLDRAGQKAALHDQYQERGRLKPINLNKNHGDTDELLWRRCVVAGQYLADRHFLLDNQVNGGIPGYFVYSVFAIQGRDKRVLVNRGWIPVGRSRNVVPEINSPQQNVSLSGIIKLPPAPGLLLADELREELPGNIMRLQYVDMEYIADVTGQPLLPYVLRLNPESASGFKRNWHKPGSGKDKHIGYAYQWFALAVTLIIIYIALNLKKRSKI